MFPSGLLWPAGDKKMSFDDVLMDKPSQSCQLTDAALGFASAYPSHAALA
jgi:hypothetical protein